MNFAALYQDLTKLELGDWQTTLQPLLQNAFSVTGHGDLPRWQATLAAMPHCTPSQVMLNQDTLQIGEARDLTAEQAAQLKTQLMQFHPWRKGPLSLFGETINTEWRSDWKWQRLAGHIQCAGKTILDVGCGNGYYCFRMAGLGAKLALGIDPTLVFNFQYAVCKRYLPNTPAYVLPLGIEDLPENIRGFDMVFSMGVFYHRRSPIDHLLELRERLVPGGELILETLIVEGDLHTCLVPQDRYAQMRNVWFLPSIPTLTAWLARSKYHDIQVLNVSKTSTREQRQTEWMQFQSLRDFLDPNDPDKTIEGYPAPKRAIIYARAPL